MKIRSHFTSFLENIGLGCCQFLCHLASTHGPGPLWSWATNNLELQNIQSKICSRIIFDIHTAPGLICSKCAPGFVWIQIMLQEHIWLKMFFQIMDHTSKPDWRKSRHLVHDYPKIVTLLPVFLSQFLWFNISALSALSEIHENVCNLQDLFLIHKSKAE